MRGPCPRESLRRTGYQVCLGVEQASQLLFKNGQADASSACDDAPGQQWAYGVQADPQIKVAGTDLCLDAGRAPRAGTKLRVSRCNGSAGQHWYIANTGLWILNDRSSDYLCADIRGGGRADGTALQLWPCAENNFNQHFYPGFCWSHTCIL